MSLTWLMLAALAADPTPVALPATPTVLVANDRLHLEVQAQARLDEGKLLVQNEVRLLLDEPGEARLTRVPLPLLVPVVGGVPLDDGALPEQGQAIEVEAEGSVQAERVHGSVSISGRIAQHQPAVVRVRYFIPYREAQVRLGLRGGPGPTGLAVAVQGQGEARVRLACDRPSRQSRFEQAGERLAGLALSHPLRPGEVATVWISDLPGPPHQLRRRLLAGIGIAALVVLAWVWQRRRQAGAPP